MYLQYQSYKCGATVIVGVNRKWKWFKATFPYDYRNNQQIRNIKLLIPVAQAAPYIFLWCHGRTARKRTTQPRLKLVMAAQDFKSLVKEQTKCIPHFTINSPLLFLPTVQRCCKINELFLHSKMFKVASYNVKLLDTLIIFVTLTFTEFEML